MTNKREEAWKKYHESTEWFFGCAEEIKRPVNYTLFYIVAALLFCACVACCHAAEYGIAQAVPNNLRVEKQKVPLRKIVRDVLNNASYTEIKKFNWLTPGIVLIKWQHGGFRGFVGSIGTGPIFTNSATFGELTDDYIQDYAWCYITIDPSTVPPYYTVRNVSIVLNAYHNWTEEELRRVLSYELMIAQGLLLPTPDNPTPTQ